MPAWPEMARWAASAAVENATAAGDDNTSSWDINQACQLQNAGGEQCAYVSEVIDCHSSTPVAYLEFAVCDSAHVVELVYTLFILWIAFLFLNLVLVLDSRVVPNINTVAKTMGMSDSLAGVTLLALGNGAADVFSASAAVHASPQGATMAISGLVGGGLFVVTIVAGVLTVKFEPEISVNRIGRDAGSYFISIATVGLIIFWLGEFPIWSGAVLIGIYVFYVFYVVFSERKQQSEDTLAKTEEKKGLLGNEGNPVFDSEAEAGNALDSSELIEDLFPDSKSPPPVWAYPHDGTWHTTAERALAVVLNTTEEDWADKSTTMKAIVVLQLPVSVLLLLTTPYMYHGDAMRSWDRNLHVVNTLLMFPFMTLIFAEDAFYADDEVDLPPLVISLLVGVLFAVLVRLTTEVDEGPKYQSVFALAGFLVALTWIYVISDEIVAVLRTIGIMMGVSPALIGMTVLGIGNGTCDLVANFLMARAGYPSTAMAAIYAGPMFNLLVGLGLAVIAGNRAYGKPLSITSHLQVYIGMIFVLVTLFVGVLYSTSGRYVRSHGICFFTVYLLFLMITCTLYA
mmetsp:Transcript_11590/g.29752  ORF Transcript_11590/g.29752 Transcript_11590/m.29752 type:complete len:569 (+) Transcript_11590:97-1803(+)